jgi:hypothetical protein
VRAVEQIGGLDRSAVRQQFEARFTGSQMAFKYLAVYKELLVGSKRKKLSKSLPSSHSNPRRAPTLRRRPWPARSPAAEKARV